MDVEAELIRSENWSDLKRYYSDTTRHPWELAWLLLLRDPNSNSKDTETNALELFQRLLEDPHYDEAAYIVLWWLRKKPSSRTFALRDRLPVTLEVYESVETGRIEPVLRFLEKKENHVFAPHLLGMETLVKSLKTQDLEKLDKFPNRPASVSLKWAHHCDRRLKNVALAKKYYREFLADPWTRYAIQEVERQIDSEALRHLQYAYSDRDGVTIRRVLKALLARLEKPSANDPELQSGSIKNAVRVALEEDLQHISENILGFAFWKEMPLSPQAFERIRERVFSQEKFPEPPFLNSYRKFFSATRPFDLAILSECLPSALDPDRLSLWQIRVEIDPSKYLSEALLRFPQEERFLLLWSISQKKELKADRRKWPDNQRESAVVWKNLQRAFEKSSDKILWFQRIRELGCSQDFYEYALTLVSVPIVWILEDLKDHFLESTPAVRKYLKDQLSVTASSGSGTHELTPTQVLEALTFLTPAETQAILLSRYILAEEIPDEILNDETMELFWDARSQVSPETSRLWQNSILRFLQKKPISELKSSHWLWVQLAWEESLDALRDFAPKNFSVKDFPWQSYLENLEKAAARRLLLECLARIPDERMKVHYISLFLSEPFGTGPEGGDQDLILSAIDSVNSEHIRHSLLADWHESRGHLQQAIFHRHEELSQHPVLNEQLKIGMRILDLYKTLDMTAAATQASAIDHLGNFLEKNGGLSTLVTGEIAEIFVNLSNWQLAWKWAIRGWNISSDAQKEVLLKQLLDLSFRARTIDETQRLLVDYVFNHGTPGDLTKEILNSLLDPDSVFRIKHLRKEFIDRASQILPLHQDVLRAKSEYDYRAYLLWQSFYGEMLDVYADMPSFSKKRKYELWRFTESAAHLESLYVFAKYFQYSQLSAAVGTQQADTNSVQHPFLDKAKRIFHRLSKSFGIRKSIEIQIFKELRFPFQFSLERAQLTMQEGFFSELDEETWSALAVGALQAFDDWDRGLYDERRLVERFFQGMLLSGAPLPKLLRLWIWLAIQEKLVAPTILRVHPDELISKLPFLNALVIFYLSPDFAQKMEECAIAVR